MLKNVQVLLATYNGEDYIEEQLISLFNQTYQEFELLIRDDGSTDCTLEIVEKYKLKYSNRIKVIIDNKKGLGPSGNFSELMRYATADYIMFCDQDDIWIPHKIEITLEKMLELEKAYGVAAPILVHSDLTIVDRDLNVINSSMSQAQKLYANENDFNQLLMQNTITGCTMMINKALREMTRVVPKEAIMHDWWLGLVASSLGTIGYIDEALILYRQHGKNDVGAQVLNFNNVLKKANKNGFDKAYQSIEKSIKQAQIFYQLYSKFIPKKNQEIVEDLINIKQYNKLKRVTILCKHKLYKKGILRNIVLFTII